MSIKFRQITQKIGLDANEILYHCVENDFHVHFYYNFFIQSSLDRLYNISLIKYTLNNLKPEHDDLEADSKLVNTKPVRILLLLIASLYTLRVDTPH